MGDGDGINTTIRYHDTQNTYHLFPFLIVLPNLDVCGTFCDELEWCAHHPGKEDEAAHRLIASKKLGGGGLSNLPKQLLSLIKVFTFLLFILSRLNIRCM